MMLMMFLFVSKTIFSQIQNGNQNICNGTIKTLSVKALNASVNNWQSTNQAAVTVANGVITGINNGTTPLTSTISCNYVDINDNNSPHTILTGTVVITVLPTDNSLVLQVRPENPNFPSVCQANMTKFIASPTPTASGWSIISPGSYSNLTFSNGNNTVIEDYRFSSGRAVPYVNGITTPYSIPLTNNTSYTNTFFLSNGTSCSAPTSIGVIPNTVADLPVNSSSSNTIIATSPFTATNTGFSFCSNTPANLKNNTTNGVWLFSNSTASYLPVNAPSFMSTSAGSSSNVINVSPGMITNSNIPILSSSGTASIVYKVTDASNGCYKIVGNLLKILPSPNTPSSITGTTDVCVGLTTTLSDVTSGGQWSTSNSNIATVDNSGVVTGVSAGSVTITYTVTNTSGCFASVSTIVTVNTKCCPETCYWTLNGNSLTTTDKYIGTNNATDFVVKTGGNAATNERIRVKANGNVGIGTFNSTTSPIMDAKLSIDGNLKIGVVDDLTLPPNTQPRYLYVDATTKEVKQTTLPSPGITSNCGNANTIGKIPMNADVNGNLTCSNIFQDATGNIGINTTAPAVAFHVLSGGTVATGVRLEGLPQTTVVDGVSPYKTLYVDDYGNVFKGSYHNAGLRTSNSTTSPSQQEFDNLKTELADLKQQVKALLEARNYSPCTVAQPSGTLEVVPTPFANDAKAIYSIENFNGEASLQVADLSGKVLKTFTINQAKGQIEIGTIQISTSTVVFTIVSGGKVVVSKKSIKVTE